MKTAEEFAHDDTVGHVAAAWCGFGRGGDVHSYWCVSRADVLRRRDAEHATALATANARVAELEREVAGTEKAIKRRNDMVIGLVHERDDLRARLAAVESERDALNTRLFRALDERDDRRAERDAARARIKLRDVPGLIAKLNEIDGACEMGSSVPMGDVIDAIDAFLAATPAAPPASDATPRTAPVEPRQFAPAVCTHPGFDESGRCYTCGDVVALAVPCEFAKAMADIHRAATPHSPPPETCPTCGLEMFKYTMASEGKTETFMACPDCGPPDTGSAPWTPHAEPGPFVMSKLPELLPVPTCPTCHCAILPDGRCVGGCKPTTCAAWCGWTGDVAGTDRPCTDECWRPGRGEFQNTCFCTEACRDAGRPLNPPPGTTKPAPDGEVCNCDENKGPGSDGPHIHGSGTTKGKTTP